MGIKRTGIEKVLDLSNLSVEDTIRLNHIGDSIKVEFNSLSEQFYHSTKGGLAWLLNSVMKRNPYQSDLFLSVCKLMLAKELISSLNGDLTIKTKHYAIALSLNRYIKNNNFQDRIKVIGVGQVKPLFRRYKRKLIDVLKMVIRGFFHLRSKSEKRKSQVANKTDITVIDTFLLENSIKEGVFKDRYYNNILSYLEPSEAEKVFFAPSMLSSFKPGDIEKISLNSEENLLFKQDFLSIGDYLGAFRQLLGLKFPKGRFEIFKLDVTELLYNDFHFNKFDYSSFWGLLNYKFIERLKDNNIGVRLFINWNENQSIDKGFVKGVHDFFPEVTIKGYQGYIASMDYNFYIQPTDFEIDKGVVPAEICVVGDFLRSNINRFSKKTKVTVAPAFRFQGVYNVFDDEKTDIGTIKLLIALPLGIKESEDILRVVNPIVSKVDLSKYSFVIKPHPLLNMEVLRSGEYWNSAYSINTGDFIQALNTSTLLIGNTSSVMLEAIVKGKYVIIIGALNGITQNPIPKDTVDSSLWSLCYSSDELFKVLENYNQLTKEEREELSGKGKVLVKNLFEPCSRKAVGSFLEL